VVKKRLCKEAGIVVSTNKRPRLDCNENDDDDHRNNSIHNALNQCTGEAVLRTMKKKSALDGAKVWNRVNDFGVMETDTNNSRDDPVSTWPQLSNVSLIATHNDAPQWESHVQHVLQLLWRQPRDSSCSGQRFDSLARHVACQLELTMANPTWSASTGAISDWLCTQLLAFSVSATTTVANGSSGNDAKKSQDRAWWGTIWRSILQSRPTALSELLVPVLLDVLLLCGPHAIATTTTTTTTTATNTHHHSAGRERRKADTAVIGLEPMLVLSLLEAALPYAPWHILRRVEMTLLPSPPPAHRNSDNPHHWDAASPTDKNAPSLLPTNNTTWCSTNDLAHGLHTFRLLEKSLPAIPVDPPDDDAVPLSSLGLVSPGDFFLLGHGLATVSEQVIATMARASGLTPPPPALSILAPPPPRHAAAAAALAPRPRGGWPHWSGSTPP
jgi:hypothetical protein